MSGVLGYLAWIGITRPPGSSKRSARRSAPANDSLAFLSVAGDGVELEIVAPDGRRTATSGATGADRIPGSEGTVDCPRFAAPGASEEECTASISISTPSPGDYTVIVRSTRSRAIVVNVGWSTVSQLKRGGFDVRVQVAPGRPSAFMIDATRDAVGQRSEPRPVSP